MSFSRTEQLRNLEKEEVFDLLVIGGGVVGAASMAMASADNLNVILLEKNDFCFWGIKQKYKTTTRWD